MGEPDDWIWEALADEKHQEHLDFIAEDRVCLIAELEDRDAEQIKNQKKSKKNSQRATRISVENRQKDARDRKREALQMLAKMPRSTTLSAAAKLIHKEWSKDAEEAEHNNQSVPFVPKVETIRCYLKGAR